MENIAAAIPINRQLLRSAVLKPQFLPWHFMPRKKLLQPSLGVGRKLPAQPLNAESEYSPEYSRNIPCGAYISQKLAKARNLQTSGNEAKISDGAPIQACPSAASSPFIHLVLALLFSAASFPPPSRLPAFPFWLSTHPYPPTPFSRLPTFPFWFSIASQSSYAISPGNIFNLAFIASQSSYATISPASISIFTPFVLALRIPISMISPASISIFAFQAST